MAKRKGNIDWLAEARRERDEKIDAIWRRHNIQVACLFGCFAAAMIGAVVARHMGWLQ